MGKDIVKTPCKRLTKKQLTQLASFTDPGTVLTALAKEGWSIEESIQHLVTIAKGDAEGVKTSTQLNAIRYLNQLIIDAMERSGLMVMATKKFVGEGGEEMRFSGHVVSSVLRGQKEQTTPAELSTDTIEEENKNGNTRSKNGKDGKDEGGKGSKKSRKNKGAESSLHSSKFPIGREAERGHFNGISKQDGSSADEGNSADFI